MSFLSCLGSRGQTGAQTALAGDTTTCAREDTKDQWRSRYVLAGVHNGRWWFHCSHVSSPLILSSENHTHHSPENTCWLNSEKPRPKCVMAENRAKQHEESSTALSTALRTSARGDSRPSEDAPNMCTFKTDCLSLCKTLEGGMRHTSLILLHEENEEKSFFSWRFLIEK